MSDSMERETAGVARSVMTLEVAPGMTAEFAAFERRVMAACQAFPGFLSIEIARPDAGVQDHPTVMLITLWLVPPLKRRFPQPVWMFISNLVSVAFLQYVAIDVVKRALRFWLRPDVPARPRANRVGLAIVVGAYALFIAVFMGIVR
jgi:antibiotic biosynthesis monooxygenase (ABM) superfamily enzyme